MMMTQLTRPFYDDDDDDENKPVWPIWESFRREPFGKNGGSISLRLGGVQIEAMRETPRKAK
jgi:hypothetical protein